MEKSARLEVRLERKKNARKDAGMAGWKPLYGGKRVHLGIRVSGCCLFGLGVDNGFVW
jgi:hypothetical protein